MFSNIYMSSTIESPLLQTTQTRRQKYYNTTLTICRVGYRAAFFNAIKWAKIILIPMIPINYRTRPHSCGCLVWLRSRTLSQPNFPCYVVLGCTWRMDRPMFNLRASIVWGLCTEYRSSWHLTKKNSTALNRGFEVANWHRQDDWLNVYRT